MPTVQSGARGTVGLLSDLVAQNMIKKVVQLNPSAGPLTSVINILDKYLETETAEPQHAEDELLPNRDLVNGTHTAADFTIAIDNPGFYLVGDILHSPRTGENMRVTVASGSGSAEPRTWRSPRSGGPPPGSWSRSYSSVDLSADVGLAGGETRDRISAISRPRMTIRVVASGPRFGLAGLVGVENESFGSPGGGPTLRRGSSRRRHPVREPDRRPGRRAGPPGAPGEEEAEEVAGRVGDHQGPGARWQP